jgi:hypothetical protein
MMHSRAQKIIAILLLVLGLQIWLTIGHGHGIDVFVFHWHRIGLIGAYPQALIWAAAIALIPPARRFVFAQLQRMRDPSPAARAWSAVAIAIASTCYLLWTGHYQHRDFIAKFHDEFMHLLQIQMLAHGHLWYPQHPLADFFESFHIFVKPVYASIYFPGTALAYVPIVWLRIPFWIATAIVSGASVGVLYRVVSEFLDGVCGALAALLLISLTMFRYLSLIVMSHSVMLLLGLTLIWAYLRWRKEHSLAWAAAIGAIGGWAAITRPADALCYAIPIAVAMLAWLLQQRRGTFVRTVLVIVACAAPFIALQLALDRGVTGHWLLTPYRVYCDMFTPQMSFGFHRIDPNARPQTTLQQRIDYYRDFTVGAVAAHRPELVLRTWAQDRLPCIATFALPNPLLLILLPIGLMALRGRRWLLVGVLPIWIALYSFFAYVMPHYVVVIAPAVIFLVLLGMRALEQAWPRANQAIAVGCTIAIAGMCLRELPEFNHHVRDDPFNTPTMLANARLPSLIKRPAIVLFRYEPHTNPHNEPVYNVDVPWPDDAPIIRAHDLGARNHELFDFYAARQPQREVYLFDRATGALHDLGNVAALARSYNRP